jgi:aldose 1-epimerase
MVRVLAFLVLLCLVAFSLASGAEAGKRVGVYNLRKGNFSVKMTNWGATIMSIALPDSKGTMIKVCFDTRKIM